MPHLSVLLYTSLMNMIRHILSAVGIAVCCAMVAQSNESFEEYKKRVSREYNEYISKENAAFAAMLKEQWDSYEALSGKERRRKEPVKPVHYELPTEKPETIQLKIDPVTTQESPKIVPLTKIQPAPKVTPPSLPQSVGYPVVVFSFYNISCEVHPDPKLKITLQGNDESRVAEGFEAMGKTKYESLIGELAALRSRFALSDWYYARLVRQFVSTWYGAAQGDAGVLCEFFLLY